MKFGKFEISEFCIGAICFTLLVYIVLNATLSEEEMKEKTKQLELQKEIVLLEKGKN